MKAKNDTAVLKCLGVKEKDITYSVDNKSSQTNMLMAFSNASIAAQITQKLFELGIGSSSNAGMKKSVLPGNKVVLTPNDIELLNKAFAPIQKEANFLSTQLNANATIIPSMHHKSKNVNISVTFESAKAAENFVNELSKKGVGSLTNPGQPKTIQAGNVVILTTADCQKLANASAPKNANPGGFFKPAPQQAGFERGADRDPKYTTDQQSIYDFALNCCDFPTLVVALYDKGYDPNLASRTINDIERLAPGKKFITVDEVAQMMDAQMGNQPR